MTTSSSGRPRGVHVYPMGDEGDAEFGYVVRGTDLDEVTLALAAHIASGSDNNMAADDEPTYVPALIGDGWYRRNPCNVRSCFAGVQHSGHLADVDGPGLGRWYGFRFDWQMPQVHSA